MVILNKSLTILGIKIWFFLSTAWQTWLNSSLLLASSITWLMQTNGSHMEDRIQVPFLLGLDSRWSLQDERLNLQWLRFMRIRRSSCLFQHWFAILTISGEHVLIFFTPQYPVVRVPAVAAVSWLLEPLPRQHQLKPRQISRDTITWASPLFLLFPYSNFKLITWIAG